MGLHNEIKTVCWFGSLLFQSRDHTVPGIWFCDYLQRGAGAMTAYELTWWTDAGAFSEVFDTLEEARSKRNRVEDMGYIEWTIKRVP